MHSGIAFVDRSLCNVSAISGSLRQKIFGPGGSLCYPPCQRVESNSKGGIVKKQSILFVLAATLAAFAAACNEAEEVSKAVSVKLDPALSSKEMNLLRADVASMTAWTLTADSSPANVGTAASWYGQVFNGNGSLDAVRNMDERVNYVLPESVKLEDRLGVAEDPLTDAVTVASNIGTILFFVQKSNPDKKLYFKIGNAKVGLDSSRVGIIRLGPGYTMEKLKDGTPLTAVFRTATLVHEGRHSDCTGGLKASDLELLKLGQIPVNKNCGHLHVKCPPGHDLAGYYACDGHPWGAYAVGAVYNAKLARACANCSELEKQQALLFAADSLSRVLSMEDLLAGKQGAPDMTSLDDVTRAQILDEVRAFRAERALDVENVGAQIDAE